MTAYPGDAGPVVRHPMRLPITAGSDAVWIQTRYSSDSSCTEMQCLDHSATQEPRIHALIVKCIFPYWATLEKVEDDENNLQNALNICCPVFI
jgi:hypothetical protein